MRYPLCLSLLSLIALGPGCATSEEPGDPYALDPRENCVRIRTVRNWDALDDEHLWLEANGGRQYLMTLWARCPGIRFSQVIALSNAGGRICPNDFGSVLYDDGRQPMRCQVGNVEPVGSRGEAEAIIEERRAHGD
jgi:hypothetical protein